MMRPSRSRPALAVVLTLALLATLTLGVGAATANSARPADSARLATDELAISQAVVGGAGLESEPGVARLADGPTGRFAFSVLDQAATSVSKTISSVNGVAQPAGTTNVNVAQGDRVVFQITVSNIQRNFVRDFLSPNFTFVSSSVTCVTAPATGEQPVVPPSGVAAGASVRDCAVPGTGSGGSGNATFTITANVTVPSSTTLPTTDTAANEACAGQVAPTDPGVCSLPVQVGIVSGTLTPTPPITNTPTLTSTPTPTRTATPTAPSTQTIATVVATLTPTGNTPCATQVTQQCTVTGTLAGSVGTKVGSMNWTIIVPGGLIPAGTVATVLIQTTVNLSGEILGPPPVQACPVSNGTSQVTCTGGTVGDGLTGGTIAVVLPSGAIVATGTIVPAAPLTGPPVIVPGAAGIAEIPRVAIPAVPAPPVQFIPPAPAPLLPPVGPLPPLQGAAPPAYPEVPVIPEADTLPLVLVGIAALGGYAAWRGWRSCRGPRPED